MDSSFRVAKKYAIGKFITAPGCQPNNKCEDCEDMCDDVNGDSFRIESKIVRLDACGWNGRETYALFHGTEIDAEYANKILGLTNKFELHKRNLCG